MKRISVLLMTLAGFSSTLLADTAVIPVPPPPTHRILVWAMGKPSPDIAEVELDVLEALAKRNVPGERVSKFFPTGLPLSAREAIAQMRTTGCDVLLAMRRRATIDWETPNKEHTYSSLEAFLNHRAQLQKPKNQTETDANVPIEVSNAYGNTAMEISKGEVMVFDLKSEKDIWHGDSQVKTAKDLPQADYYKRVAEKVASSLATVGIIPAVKK